jgi:transposase
MPKRLALRRFHRGEKQKLDAKARDRKLSAGIAQRYRLIGLVYGGLSVLSAVRRLNCAPKTGYHWVHEFNANGFRNFQRASNPDGRPTQLSKQDLQTLRQVATQRPTECGLPFTNWSMTTLREYLVKKRSFPVTSTEWLRRLLHREHISWQRTKTWKQSTDPAFAAKKSAF